MPRVWSHAITTCSAAERTSLADATRSVSSHHHMQRSRKNFVCGCHALGLMPSPHAAQQNELRLRMTHARSHAITTCSAAERTSLADDSRHHHMQRSRKNFACGCHALGPTPSPHAAQQKELRLRCHALGLTPSPHAAQQKELRLRMPRARSHAITTCSAAERTSLADATCSVSRRHHMQRSRTNFACGCHALGLSRPHTPARVSPADAAGSAASRAQVLPPRKYTSRRKRQT